MASQTSGNGPWEIFVRTQVPRVYAGNRMVYFQGDTAESFYYLIKGRVRVFLTSENGDEKTLTLLEGGNIFGEAAFFDGLPRVSSAKTMMKSEIIPISRPVLLNCFQREPGLAMHMLQLLANTVRMLSAQVDSMTFLQADKRLARLLITLTAGREDAPVPYTHEELANLAGTSRVTVSKILGAFQRKGWVRTGYRSVVVTAPAALDLFSRDASP